jgi:hypothetical protein
VKQIDLSRAARFPLYPTTITDDWINIYFFFFVCIMMDKLSFGDIWSKTLMAIETQLALMTHARHTCTHLWAEINHGDKRERKIATKKTKEIDKSVLAAQAIFVSVNML